MLCFLFLYVLFKTLTFWTSVLADSVFFVDGHLKVACGAVYVLSSLPLC